MTKEENWLVVREVSQIPDHPVVFSIPKKVIPKSTQRSRIKRMLRESIRQGGFGPSEGKSLKFIIRKSVPGKLKTQDVLAYLTERIGS